VLLAAALWWPVGFWGLDSWLHLPLRALDGDLVLLGATAAAASVSLLVRSPWPRFAVVVLFSVIGWVLSAPSVDDFPDERETLVILLVGAATVLAVVAGLSPATWPHGLPVAVALALPFVVASWQKVAPTVLSLVRILLTWLVFALGARALREGWNVLHPQMQAGSKRAELRLVADASWGYVRRHWWDYPSELVAHTAGWLLVAAILALLVAATRAVTSGVRRRSRDGSSSRPGS
jgi:hypothetical protein